jgi:sugar phosphate isomerase/epimerase
MRRRQFLHSATTVAFGAAIGGSALDLALRPARADGCGAPPSSVQLFTVREALQRDPRAALAKLRDLGIVEAELYGLNGPENATLFGLAAADLKRAFDANGIRVPYSHIGGGLTNTKAIAEIARALDVDTLIVALPAEFSGRGGMVPAEGRAQLDALAEKLNRVGREYRDEGLTFGYHNHHVEFMPVEGLTPYDYLMSHTDPALVKIELDLGWLAYSGVDPVAYLRRHAGRVVSCHLKDYAPTIATEVPQRKLVAPGAGTVDFAAVLRAMSETGVAHGFIEVDVSDDPFGDIERGREHLRTLGHCA